MKNLYNQPCRRDLFRFALPLGVVCSTGTIGFGASPFWNRKQTAEWTPEEVEQLLTNSPWARKVPMEIKGARSAGAASMDTSGSRGTFGGMHGADSNGISESRGPKGGVPSAPPASRREVMVRWESARPMLEATGKNLPPAFENSYAVSVTGLPPAVLIVGVAGTGNTESTNTDPAERQRAVIQRLLGATTLASKGHEAKAASFVVQSPDKASLIFGFGRDTLPLTLDDREIIFSLELGVVKVQAKFETKAMTVNGQLSL